MVNDFKVEIETIAILIAFQLTIPRLLKIYGFGVDKLMNYLYPNNENDNHAERIGLKDESYFDNNVLVGFSSTAVEL